MTRKSDKLSLNLVKGLVLGPKYIIISSSGPIGRAKTSEN